MRIPMKKLIFTSLLLCTSFLAVEPSYAVALYFPHVDTTFGWQTEIAIINTSPDQNVTGTLRALSNAGQLVETSRSHFLPAAGGRSLLQTNLPTTRA